MIFEFYRGESFKTTIESNASLENIDYLELRIGVKQVKFTTYLQASSDDGYSAISNEGNIISINLIPYHTLQIPRAGTYYYEIRATYVGGDVLVIAADKVIVSKMLPDTELPDPDPDAHLIDNFNILKLSSITDDIVTSPSGEGTLHFYNSADSGGIVQKDSDGNIVRLLIEDDLDDYLTQSDLDNYATTTYVDNIINQKSTTIESVYISENYTLGLSDAGKSIKATDGLTITIPNDSSVDFPNGTIIHIMNLSVSDIIIDSEGSANINIASGFISQLRDQYSVCSIEKIDDNEWIIYGDLKEDE